MKRVRRTLVVTACMAVLLTAGQVFGQDWPQWRGPGRDGKATDFKVPDTWPKDLVMKWKVTVGAGDAAPVLVGDKLYVFARQGDDEVTLCLSAADGKELWRDKNPVPAISGPAAREHGGPRSTPVVADGKVVTLGISGVLSCLNAADGRVLWRKNEIKGTPRFFTASSPLVVDGMAVAQLGSAEDGAIVAYDLATGAEKWKYAGPGAGPGYASPVVATIDGVKQVIVLTEKSVEAVSAADGKPLWSISFAAQGRSYNAATPLVVGSTVIFSGQGRGTKAVKVAKKDGKWTTEELWSNPLGVQFSTPVLNGGMLYAVSEKGNLCCLNATSGETVWADEAKLGGYGCMLDLGKAVLALPSRPELIVIKPGEKQFTELARYKAGDSATYSYPIASGNRIFVKDQENLILWTLE